MDILTNVSPPLSDHELSPQSPMQRIWLRLPPLSDTVLSLNPTSSVETVLTLKDATTNRK